MTALETGHPVAGSLRFLPALLLLAVFAPLLRAQTANGVVTPSECLWRAGDNPAWAAPDLNTAGWHPLMGGMLPLLSTPHLWIRCSLPLARLRSVAQPALSITAVATYQVYVQGSRIGEAGNLRTGDFSMNTVRIVRLPEPLPPGPSAVIAFRVVQSRWIFGRNLFALTAADASILRYLRERSIFANIKPLLPSAIIVFISGILGFVPLGLFFYDRTRRDLLWISFSCIFVAVEAVVLLSAAARLDYSARLLDLVWILGNLGYIVEILFFFALARKRIPWFVWGVYLVSELVNLPFLVQIFLPPGAAWRLSSITGAIAEIAQWGWPLMTLAPFVAFWPWSRVSPRLRPLAICCFLWGLSDFTHFFLQELLPVLHRAAVYRSAAPALYDVEALFTGTAVIALLWLLFRDQRRIVEERAALAGEMNAAQQVQHMLAAATLDTAPGLRVSVAFQPMKEVGGDFYCCRILPGNRQRVIIGDVSGKGAAAAMTAAVLLGAAQRHDTSSPATLLRHLNLVFSDMRLAGFATCLCAELSPEGGLTLANAGHLAPYRNGEEIPIEGGLPLGVAPGTEYSESTLDLAAGDSLTFVSDGVVEARNPAGDLFGFDRTQAISTQSAEEIARQASSHGQNDDITVLTLGFVPDPVASA